MKYSVSVGSQNPVKVSAVKEALENYDAQKWDITGVDVESNVNEQPQSLEETFQGATNRASNAFSDNSQISIGLEDGIFPVPGKDNTFMNICCCAIYDGNRFHYGTSSAFEYPTEITDLVKGRGLDVCEALGAAGYTSNPKIGSSEGAIGILSKGRLVRKDYTIQAVNAALIHLKTLWINK